MSNGPCWQLFPNRRRSGTRQWYCCIRWTTGSQRPADSSESANRAERRITFLRVGTSAEPVNARPARHGIDVDTIGSGGEMRLVHVRGHPQGVGRDRQTRDSNRRWTGRTRCPPRRGCPLRAPGFAGRARWFWDRYRSGTCRRRGPGSRCLCRSPGGFCETASAPLSIAAKTPRGVRSRWRANDTEFAAAGGRPTLGRSQGRTRLSR